MDPIHPITINGNTLEKAGGGRTALSFGSPAEDAVATDYIVVQASKDTLEDEDYHKLDSNGVELLDLISDQTYLCRYQGTDFGALRQLECLSFVDTYKADFVIAASLKQQTTTQQHPFVIQQGQEARVPKDQETVEVDVILHSNPAGQEENIKQEIVRLAAVDPSTVIITADGGRIRAQLSHATLVDVAKIDLVQAIVPVHSVKLMNDVARRILHSDIEINGTAFKGQGQIICVADTGFDLGDITNLPPAFKGRGDAITLLPVGRKGMTDDPDGHGTHVCGSVVRDGVLQDGKRVEAAASRADLIVQSILASGGDGLMPGSLNALLGDAYDKGARVHTNSWGASIPSIPYEATSSRVLDDFVYTHKDLVVLFAAGNDGVDATSQPGSLMRPDQPDGVVDLAQVGAEAVAKNIITVGACESERTDVAWNGSTWGKWRSKFPVAPLRQEHFANSRDDMAAFSSRGPALADKGDTKHLRIKPDVVAPGTAILSTKSRHPAVRGDTHPGYGPSPDPDWTWEFGTSMACPLVAGCCAVIREYLEKSSNHPSNAIAIESGRGGTPSAALVKAALINGAVPLATESEHPNFAAGFGRVDLERSIVPSDTLAIANASGFLEGSPLRQGETNTITVIIPTTTTACTFKVTLVWTDFPGKLLVNDLDLVVKATDEERHGNIKPGSNEFDRVNNVEQVTWENVPSGECQIVVQAHRVIRLGGSRTQDYALVWKLFA